ncbi:MAG: hypothetical protein NWP87_01125 [Winogradskyella sp.]|nr:hypothetical protein [Winogradskyella sp.]
MNNVLIPITVGIVGHRDADITEKHVEVLESIFNEISGKYPNSPVSLFSQLALGADTEVTKIFLKLKEEKKRNYNLVVPLPFDIEYYKKTQFSNKEQLEVFNTIIKKSERLYVLNKLSEEAKIEVDKNSKVNLDEINTFYRKGGEFIADSAVVFIVLWEEIDNKLEGGSSNIVTYKETGTYQKYISEHIFDTTGSLITIPCNRMGNKKERILKYDYFKNLLKDISIKKSLKKIEELNTCFVKNLENHENIHDSDIYPNVALSHENETLKTFFLVVDEQANRRQKNYNNILKGLFSLGFIIFGAFESYKHLGYKSELFFTTIALIVFSFSVFKISYKSNNHQKYIENRVLAEALRIQFFWNISSIDKSVSEYIIRIHKKEYNWLKQILQSIHGLTKVSELSKQEPLTDIVRYWIISQKNYFFNKVEQIERKEKKHKIVSRITFGLGLIVLVLIFFLKEDTDKEKLIKHSVTVIDSVIFGCFALIKAYHEKKGYAQVINQYTLMHDIYTATHDKIEEISNSNTSDVSKEIKRILHLAGKEAIIENGNWYMVYKDKEPEVEGIG